MKASIAHFTEKGQTELPFVESRYKEILTQQGEEAAKEYLTGYTADFAGATMLRWREMETHSGPNSKEASNHHIR